MPRTRPLPGGTARWQRYANVHGDSGVVAWTVADGGIAIEFRDGAVYAYSAADIGADAISRMQALAVDGRGLATWINRHVRGRFAARHDDRDAFEAARHATPSVDRDGTVGQ